MRVLLVSRFKSALPSPSMIDAIIVLTLCWTIFQFVYPSWRLPRAQSPQAPPIAVNGTATLPGVDWSTASTTVALAFTLACQYCQAGGDFYRTLAATVTSNFDQRLVIVSPDSRPAVAEWMHAHGVDAFEHVNENFALHGFILTPTLALIDNTGRITDIAVGKLSPTEEAQVIARLDGTAETPLSIRVDRLKIGAAR